MRKEWGKRLGGESGLEERGKAWFRRGGSALGISSFGVFWRLSKPSETAYYGLALKMLPWSPLEESICQEPGNSKFLEVLMGLIFHAVEKPLKIQRVWLAGLSWLG